MASVIHFLPTTQEPMLAYVLVTPIAITFFCFIAFHKFRNLEDPFSIPYTLPFLKSTIPFVFDGFNFLRDSIRQFPYASTLSISIFQQNVYLVQGPQFVTELFRSHNVTVTRSWSLVLKQCFGMKQSAVDAYIADTSGTRRECIPGSTPKLRDRISYLTHENLVSGLLKEGLDPTTQRFRNNLQDSFKEMDVGHDWVYMPDMMEFFQHHHGTALIRALFGDALLAQEPEFVPTLWKFDAEVLSLAQGFPSLWKSRAYRVRDWLIAAVNAWQANALTSQTQPNARNHLESDSLRGSRMMRERYEILMNATGQDEASVASTNLSFMWASITNVVPSSMCMAIHIFSSQSLVRSMRKSLMGNSPQPNIKDLESVPLLVSTYAETLRLGVQIHVPRSAPYHDLDINGVTIPRDSLIIVNTHLAHTDDRVWDTQGEKRPLDEFCAQRFLVDPSDPSSGPAKQKRVNKTEWNQDRVHFSCDGLEGAWIPFGGGHQVCPGRVLAKRVMLLSTATLLRDFDIEILADKNALKFGHQRFGFGVSTPTGPVPFRIRRRNHVCMSDCACFEGS